MLLVETNALFPMGATALDIAQQMIETLQRLVAAVEDDLAPMPDPERLGMDPVGLDPEVVAATFAFVRAAKGVRAVWFDVLSLGLWCQDEQGLRYITDSALPSLCAAFVQTIQRLAPHDTQPIYGLTWESHDTENPDAGRRTGLLVFDATRMYPVPPLTETGALVPPPAEERCCA